MKPQVLPGGAAAHSAWKQGRLFSSLTGGVLGYEVFFIAVPPISSTE